MKKIILNDSTKIYIENIANYDKEILKKQLIKNFEFSQGSEKDGLDISGEQSILLIETKEINEIKNKCIKCIESINKKANTTYYTKNWIYVNDSKTKNVFYHEHQNNKEISNLKIQWVYTFYIQMPNNLNEDEGCIFFKTNDGVEHKFLPEEGDVFIFPANLLHRPELSPNTSQKRIVFAGVYSEINMDKSYIKSNKTLF